MTSAPARSRGADLARLTAVAAAGRQPGGAIGMSALRGGDPLRWRPLACTVAESILPKILIADDVAFMRHAVCKIGSADAANTKVGEARDGQDGLDLARTLRPDVNPFMATAREVLLAELGRAAERGPLALKKSPDTTDDVTAMLAVTGWVHGLVLSTMTEEPARHYLLWMRRGTPPAFRRRR